MSNKNTMFMICEEATISSPRIISSDTNEIIIETKLQDLNKFNRNGRIYREDLKKALTTDTINELTSARSWFGEAGHPACKDMSRQVTIDPTLISHEIRSIRIDGDDIYGMVHSIPTTYGRQFRDLALRGTKLAFSLRAVGNVKQLGGGKVEVIAPMRVITYDWVILPSHRDAYMTRIVSESYTGEGEYPNSMDENGVIKAVELSKVLSESTNVKGVVEALNFAYSDISISKDGKFAICKEANSDSKLYIELEEYISKEANKCINELYNGNKRQKDIIDYAYGISKDNLNIIKEAIGKGPSTVIGAELPSLIDLCAKNRIFNESDLLKYIKKNKDFVTTMTNAALNEIGSPKLTRKLLSEGMKYLVRGNTFITNEGVVTYDGENLYKHGSLSEYLAGNMNQLVKAITYYSKEEVPQTKLNFFDCFHSMSELERYNLVCNNLRKAPSYDDNKIRMYIAGRKPLFDKSIFNKKSLSYTDYFKINIYALPDLLEYISIHHSEYQKYTKEAVDKIREIDAFNIYNVANIDSCICVYYNAYAIKGPEVVFIDNKASLFKYKNKSIQYINFEKLIEEDAQDIVSDIYTKF